MRRYGGFTLAEVLVSIGIFAVVAAAMLSMLFGATELFRGGEAARQAGDEATAVIATLRADLARAVPVRWRDGRPAPEAGWFYSSVIDEAGNVLLAFVVETPDRLAVDSTGSNARRLVSWYVGNAGTPSDPTDDVLFRKESNWRPSDGGDRQAAVDPRDGEAVSTGCLHFGTWFELSQTHRPVYVDTGTGETQIEWENSNIPPYVDDPGTTANDAMPMDTGATVSSVSSAGTPITFYPNPDAMRISLVLTGGGRFPTRGTLARDLNTNDPTARVAGIKSLATVSGSLLRIGNEWVRYEDFRNGQLTGIRHGQLRSAAQNHQPRTAVTAGLQFSLVVPLPR
jgi:type II secretory pathway component PulJ